MIGIIDSGVGGLSVLRKIEERFPSLSYVYHADSAFAPYGEKTPAFLRERVTKIVQYLIKNYHISTLMIACNTSSTVVLPHLIPLLQKEQIPYVDMISASETAIQKVVQPPAEIGVLATTATVQSQVYQKRFGQLGYHVTAVACPLLVPLVEQGKLTGEKVVQIVEKYLKDLPQTQYILLGCTHYPFLLHTFQQAAPDVTFIDPADACAQLLHPKSETTQQKIFLTSGNPESFQTQVEVLLRKNVIAQHTDIR